jgi:hypothetical protein
MNSSKNSSSTSSASVTVPESSGAQLLHAWQIQNRPMHAKTIAPKCLIGFVAAVVSTVVAFKCFEVAIKKIHCQTFKLTAYETPPKESQDLVTEEIPDCLLSETVS